MKDNTESPAFWIVLDKRNNPSVPRPTRRLAELEREAWDVRFDALAPHRVVKYIPTGEDHGDHADPAVPQEAA